MKQRHFPRTETWTTHLPGFPSSEKSVTISPQNNHYPSPVASLKCNQRQVFTIFQSGSCPLILFTCDDNVLFPNLTSHKRQFTGKAGP